MVHSTVFIRKLEGHAVRSKFEKFTKANNRQKIVKDMVDAIRTRCQLLRQHREQLYQNLGDNTLLPISHINAVINEVTSDVTSEYDKMNAASGKEQHEIRKLCCEYIAVQSDRLERLELMSRDETLLPLNNRLRPEEMYSTFENDFFHDPRKLNERALHLIRDEVNLH